MATRGEESRARQIILWRARTAALQVLAIRHPREFIDLKNEFLVKHGHEPITKGTIITAEERGETA